MGLPRWLFLDSVVFSTSIGTCTLPRGGALGVCRLGLVRFSLDWFGLVSGGKSASQFMFAEQLEEPAAALAGAFGGMGNVTVMTAHHFCKIAQFEARLLSVQRFIPLAGRTI